ncbi:MAG: CoA transferase, partial [Frondihabitans sp.]|nr:CoA transferase [Frondihabitans sp.]
QARSGSQHATIAPYGPFTTRDETVFFGVQNEREWARFCSVVMTSDELGRDGRFTSNALRVANRIDLDTIIADAFGNWTSSAARERLDRAGIANASLRDMHGFSAHPQLTERNRWRDVESPVGLVRSLIPAVTSRESGFRMDAVPALGEHTQRVLSELAAHD